MAECLIFSRSFQLNVTVRYALAQILFTVFGDCFFLVASAHAASFDCSQAKAKMERLVCGDSELSQMDEDLAASYAELLTQATDLKAVRAQQREWLINIRKRCNDTACIKKAYALRITDLATAKQAEADLLAKSIATNIETCQLVADYANRGDLHSISVQPTTPRPEQEKLKRLMGKEVELPEYVSYWSIDLDQDGNPEHFVSVVDHEMGEGYAFARSSKKGSSVVGVNDNEDKNAYLSVLSVKARYYILSSTHPRLGKLWSLARNGEFVPICKFSQREEPIIERTHGKENPVCRETNEGRIPPVPFSSLHAISAGTQERNSRWLRPDDGLARVDVNNDGLLDNIIYFSASGPRGCDSHYLATTDTTRTHIPDIPLNNLLHRELGTDHCNRSLEILVHDGVTYVGMQSWTPHYTVYRIKGNIANTVCEFPGRVINEVIDADQEVAR